MRLYCTAKSSIADSKFIKTVAGREFLTLKRFLAKSIDTFLSRSYLKLNWTVLARFSIGILAVLVIYPP